LALCLNVFNRIVINPSFRFESRAEHEFFFLNYRSSVENELRDLHVIPDFAEDLWNAFIYFDNNVLGHHLAQKFQEEFQDLEDIDENDEEYNRKFSKYMNFKRYKAMTSFISIVRDKFELEKCSWTELLTQHLCMVANQGSYQIAEILMDLGAKTNLSGKIKNKKTCNVIIETCSCSNQLDGIQFFIKIFQKAKEDDFKQECEKIDERNIETLLDYYSARYANYNMLRKLVSTLLSKKYVLTEDAEARLKNLRF